MCAALPTSNITISSAMMQKVPTSFKFWRIQTSRARSLSKYLAKAPFCRESGPGPSTFLRGALWARLGTRSRLGGADPLVRAGRPRPAAESRSQTIPRQQAVFRICQKLPRRLERGSALLAVLWLSAALAAIAFALSNTVRSETDRASTSVDGLRSYYLAVGSIERASLELLWGATNLARRKIPDGAMAVNYTFPSGEARVEIIPETAKLDVNLAPAEELYRLLVAMGVEPGRARQITLAIVDWRTPLGVGDSGAFDQYYLSLTPSFRARHASFGEIEELLLVQGVTPDIFYGAYLPAADAGNAADDSANRQRLVRREGLADCLSVFGSRGQVDMNTAPPAVLAAVGVPPEAIGAILARRQSGPVPQADFFQFAQAIGAPANRLRVGGESTVTLRATARLRTPDGKLSDLKRSVAALVKYMRPGDNAPIHILRWYDTAWSN
jgi:general secretion pathway protein K